MRYTEPDQPRSPDAETESALLRENEELKRQIHELKNRAAEPSHGVAPARLWQPSGVTIAVIVLGVAVCFGAAFLAGYVPLRKRQELIRGEAQQQEQALPRAQVIEVKRARGESELELPGSVQAITEAPILARASGYIKTRLVDIGDRVRSGQVVAEMEAPELNEQVRQAGANLELARAARDQASANYEQGKADTEFARVTAERWARLFSKGVVSKQDNDQYQTQYQARTANLQSLEKAIAVQRGNIAAAEANLSRLREMQSFLVVKAPFDGVVTLRNVDVGTLVTAGSTLLFRLAQTNTVRTYISVPQSYAGSIRPGQPARLRVANVPGREFLGAVKRTANSLDPATRTMLVEVHVPNPDGLLMPGMYAQVELGEPRQDHPVIVPSVALIVNAGGTQVAVVRPDHTVHLEKIVVGRDYGDHLEVLRGLEEGDLVIPNPGDLAREGITVIPVRAGESPGEPTR